jgi:hypothetical protein
MANDTVQCTLEVRLTVLSILATSPSFQFSAGEYQLLLAQETKKHNSIVQYIIRDPHKRLQLMQIDQEVPKEEDALTDRC